MKIIHSNFILQNVPWATMSR